MSNRAERRALARSQAKELPTNNDSSSWSFWYWHLARAVLGSHEFNRLHEYLLPLREQQHEVFTKAVCVASQRIAAELGLKVEKVENVLYALLMGTLGSQGGTLKIPILAQWHEFNRPTIEVAAKLAASLAVTNIGSGVLKEMRLPFPAVKVVFPSNFLSIPDEGGPSRKPIANVMLGHSFNSKGEDVYAFSAVAMPVRPGTSATELYTHHSTLERLYSTKEKNATLSPLDLELNEEDERVSLVARRIALNVCLMMTDSSKYREAIPKEKKKKKGSKRRLFRIIQPVRHDFREVVKDYMRGTGRSINVQCVVSGHWKLQPYGTARAERKRIFIEPYWRGPEDAPIAERPHKL